MCEEAIKVLFQRYGIPDDLSHAAGPVLPAGLPVLSVFIHFVILGVLLPTVHYARTSAYSKTT